MSRIVQVGGGGVPTTGGNLTGALALDNREGTNYNDYNLSNGSLTFSISASSDFGYAYFRVVGDGVTALCTQNNLDTVFNLQLNVPLNLVLSADTHVFVGIKTPDGATIKYLGVAIEPDVTAPTVVSFTIEDDNPDLANIVFNEDVVFPSVADLTLSGDLSDITLSNPTGANTNWSVDLSRAVLSGETGNFDYGASNTIEDDSGNGLVAGSTVVTNNVTGDIVAPIVSSATVQNADPDALVVVFSEAVNITNVTDLSLDGSWTGITITGVTGSGTNTLTFALDTPVANGEAGNFVYGASNTIEDPSNNGLVAGSTAVTNNVAATFTYLYDDHPFELAWSTYKLRSSQVYALRGRRSSDDAETDIGFTANNKIELTSPVSAGGDLTTWAGSDDVFIVTIYNQGDLVGNYDLSAANNGEQAKILNAGALIVQSGVTFMEFDGVDDGYITTDSANWLGDEFGIFGDMRSKSSHQGVVFGHLVNSPTNERFGYIRQNNADVGSIAVSNSGASYIVNLPKPFGSNVEFEWHKASFSLPKKIYLDGVLEDTESSTIANGKTISQPIEMGNLNSFSANQSPYDGYISYLVMYQTAEESNRASINSLISNVR